ncbi:hypothetical protein [Tissierella pigra]|nr:hypothetical protein [Tissierella pigra]
MNRYDDFDLDLQNIKIEINNSNKIATMLCTASTCSCISCGILS